MNMDDLVRSLDKNFFGQGKHKIACEKFLATPEAVLLDVRTREEMECLAFPLKHYVSLCLTIPLNELPDRLDEIPRDRVVGVFCTSDVRSSMAFLYLRGKGFENVRVLTGGAAGLAGQITPGNVYKHLHNTTG